MKVPSEKLSLPKRKRPFGKRKRLRQMQMYCDKFASRDGVVMNQIRIVHGASTGKEFFLRVLGEQVDGIKPILLETDQNDIVFFIDDDETALAIQAMSRRINDPSTSCPVTIISKKAPLGFNAVGQDEIDLLTWVLNDRYDAETRTLDLSYFSLDRAFHAKPSYFSLCQNNIMMAVIDLIDKYYGSVTSLIMKGNRLRFLDHFSCLKYRIRNIQTLDLSSNRATFSLSVENLSDAKGTHEGISDNNFCLSEWEYYKEKVFCREAMEIVVQLRKLPPTTHIFETFNVVDVPIVKGNIMRFSLQGFFRDASINIKNSLTDASLSVLPRYFCREFVLIDKGCGKIAIINDTLFIAIGSSKRLEDYKGILRNMIEERRRNYAEEEVQSRMEANISPTPTLPELTPKELALAGY
ncbi:unnamed protein product [Dracunculus medinensis]|uniref:NTF2 domain-containing protein n=1 Tax=Dracunculus medinensis TaxID=318479 RepID=A0A0N4U1K6_DRAME|nr:unnamed protein product [Dracunculus medinensis]